MKFKILIFILLLVSFCFSQQTNHTWGYTTAGVEYTEAGIVDIDSITTTSIVFDLQDWYPLDFSPLASDDSVIMLNSTRFHYGTFWYRIDVESATDSSSVLIKAYPGFLIYHPNDDSRITASNLNFSTTATTLQDSSSYTTNDIQWTAVNVYISDTEGKILPPEFLKLTIAWGTASNDSIDFYWDYAYIAVDETRQTVRKTTRSDGAARKQKETLH